jgi:hypothetical protein
MAPLPLCGFGLAFVLLRITSSGVDVVPDSIGLALYAVGMWRLAGDRVVLLAAAAMIGSAGVVGLISTAWYTVLLMACASRPWAQPVGIPTAPEPDTAPDMKEAPGPRR